MKYSLPPPQYWQDFQLLVEAVAKRVFPDSIVQIYGREGQTQRGLDVFVEGKNIGIQAKSRRLFDAKGASQPNGRLNEEQLEEMGKAAESFVPRLVKLIVATTALTDAALQDKVIKLNAERRKSGGFPLEIWFWDYLQAEINNYDDLLQLHYHRILPKLRGFDPDAVLLATVSDAFHRPALITPVRCENSGDDFLQALKDVQEALATGVSHDRETRQVRSRAIYGYPNAKDRRVAHSLKLAWESLQQTRNEFTRGLARQVIEQRQNFLQIRDLRVERRLDELRKQAIAFVNEAMKVKECTPILERDWF